MVAAVDATGMTVVAAVDRSSRGPDVVEEGRRLAAAFEDELHVVHVLGQSEFLELERTSVDDTGQPVPMDEVRAVAGTIAGEAATDVAPDAETVGLVGDASDEIVRYAAEVDARYVVIGGRKRSPVGKAVFGSVTQDVLLSADRPVLSFIQRTTE